MISAEDLFRDHFLPQYPEDAKGDLGRARTTDANPANNPTVLAHLGEAAAVFVALAPTALGITEGELELDFTDASVHRLSNALTPARRERLVERKELFEFVVHGSAYVGACIVRSHGGVWAVRRPLWESLVRLRSRSGDGELPVFHWWLKSLADDAAATLADRYRANVEVPCTAAADLPIFVTEARDLPRLKRPRYDVFYKYLKAHLPEVKDVGEAFPSPERFEELRFEHLSFLVVGDGRMVVVHGANEHGLHAYWLGKEGFEKSAFWPADKFPEPLLRKHAKDPEKLEVALSHDGATRSFELLWWGP